jgi:hypothetical protein
MTNNEGPNLLTKRKKNARQKGRAFYKVAESRRSFLVVDSLHYRENLPLTIDF